ncbi:hypothetical protein APX70_06274 [Pseudomonas syringae pv. maculicola]|uniref:Uncharacterized protein n=1 Tax=Pseudomonas syringae pv. maculicola TaxID=59511 RepID=A0A3M2WQG1_PSEYM|nr:hypothetical protein APX70_06274 [Pseudomonas syringae pv. maculicola]
MPHVATKRKAPCCRQKYRGTEHHTLDGNQLEGERDNRDHAEQVEAEVAFPPQYPGCQYRMGDDLETHQLARLPVAASANQVKTVAIGKYAEDVRSPEDRYVQRDEHRQQHTVDPESEIDHRCDVCPELGSRVLEQLGAVFCLEGHHHVFSKVRVGYDHEYRNEFMNNCRQWSVPLDTSTHNLINELTSSEQMSRLPAAALIRTVDHPARPYQSLRKHADGTSHRERLCA